MAARGPIRDSTTAKDATPVVTLNEAEALKDAMRVGIAASVRDDHTLRFVFENKVWIVSPA